MHLNLCKICGSKPNLYETTLAHKGCFLKAHYVECDHDDETDELFPFLEHRMTVYGSNVEEAEKRWNEVNAA